jgi:non-ribosomal peptide synthetase component E (peptide arylation enzyme)
VIGEIGVAFVVARDPASPPTVDELKRWCRERLADYKTPDRVEFVDEMPFTTMMMKIDKKALRARLTQ